MLHHLTEYGAVGLCGILGIKTIGAIRRAAMRGMLRAMALGLVRILFWLGVLAASFWATDKAVSLWVLALARMARQKLAHWTG
jgi:hypothetical protein